MKLLNNAPHGLAKVPKKVGKKVAVVGAGCAGMRAARELMRCGFDVTIYEVSDRIGGRLFTGGNPGDSKKTGMVMAAMRMPFFSLPGNKNCILEHYVLDEADQNGSPALYETFPNPGTAPGVTGIYFNNGLRPESDFPQPEMIM
ncbi:MAG: FAD-dependent oxidoreductase [Lentisphaerales bacterium]|nr:FAD-dependent oxidoreductase [Lentisphaerales bacterium]